MPHSTALRFTPSRCEGLPDVREVVVHPDRLEVSVRDGTLTFPFADMARRQEPRLTSLLKRLVGLRPWPPLVGERDWCRAPNERFFRWYTQPELTTYMPIDEPGGYGGSNFPRIHHVLASGGYATYDLA